MLGKILYMPYYGTAYVTLRYTVQHTLNSGNKYYYILKSEITWQIFSLTYFPNYFTVLYWLPIYLTDFEYHAGLIDWPLNYRADLDWPLNYSAGLDWPLNYRADLDWPLITVLVLTGLWITVLVLTGLLITVLILTGLLITVLVLTGL